MNRRALTGLLVVPLLVAAGAVRAQSSDADVMRMIYGSEDMVSIATGNQQPIAKAPAVATLITDDDIEAMGATELDQVLETVPGLHVSLSAVHAGHPVYIIRGIHSETNPQVLLMINGVPVTDAFQSNRGYNWGGMPARNIAYIEVIRGPGSALHGGSAMSGVINVVTKSAGDIDGLRIGAGVGSFASRGGWLQYGGRVGKTELAFFAEFSSTDGYDAVIESDFQSFLDDEVFGTDASLAPGPMNNSRERADLRVDLSRGKWRLRAGYQGRHEHGLKVGAVEALDPVGYNDSSRFNSDLTWETKDNPDWNGGARVSYYEIHRESYYQLFPPGAFGGAFPEGMIGQPETNERHTRGSVWVSYSPLQGHHLRAGAGIQHSLLYDTADASNFDPNNNAPKGSVQAVPEDELFITEEDRTVTYAYLQDQWDLARDWELTAGVRYDDYSDFGGTTNPRAALVWLVDLDLTAKLMYGRSFRPPSFQELYNDNNPTVLGNPGLDPETTETYELAFDYHAVDTVEAGLNLFYYEMDDIIRYVANLDGSKTAHNTHSQRGHGFEVEVDWNATRALEVQGNFSWQRAENMETDEAPGLAPRYQAYARATWDVQPRWKLSTQLNYVGGREREAVPAEWRTDNVDDYLTWDVALVRPVAAGDWGATLSVRNLLDADRREPSRSPGYIAEDIPLAGRSFWLEATFTL